MGIFPRSIIASFDRPLPHRRVVRPSIGRPVAAGFRFFTRVAVVVFHVPSTRTSRFTAREARETFVLTRRARLRAQARRRRRRVHHRRRRRHHRRLRRRRLSRGTARIRARFVVARPSLARRFFSRRPSVRYSRADRRRRGVRTSRATTAAREREDVARVGGRTQWVGTRRSVPSVGLSYSRERIAMKYDHVQCATSTFRRARDGVVDARDGVPDRVRARGATRVVVVVVVVVVGIDDATTATVRSSSSSSWGGGGDQLCPDRRRVGGRPGRRRRRSVRSRMRASRRIHATGDGGVARGFG